MNETQDSGSKMTGDSILHGLMTERRILLGILGLAIFFALHYFSSLLLPVFLAVLLYIVFRPLVDLLNRMKIPDAVGAGIVVLFLATTIMGGLYLLSGPARDWIDKGPYLFRLVEYRFDSVLEALKGAKKATQQLEKMTEPEGEGKVKEEVVVQGPGLADRVFSQIQSTAADAASTFVLLYFMLAWGKKTLIRLYMFWEEKKQRQAWVRTVTQVQKEISMYLLTVTLINAVLAAATTGAMMLLGMPTPAMWGVLAGLLNFVPYLGPAITIAILGAVALITFNTWFHILGPPLIYFAMTGLEGQFITPTIMGKRLTLNPLMVFFSIFFWGSLWGIIGVLLAIPILVAIKVVARNMDSLRPLREILR